MSLFCYCSQPPDGVSDALFLQTGDIDVVIFIVCLAISPI